MDAPIFLCRFAGCWPLSNAFEPIRSPRPLLPVMSALLCLTVYNHGLISFASENTSLAEALASHGFVILSIEHVEQLAELQSLNRQQPADKRRQEAATIARLKKATPEERA